MAYCVYSEALPMLNLFDLLIGGDGCPWEACEDNEATIKVVKNGFSAKLRHVSRTHKVNISGLKESSKVLTTMSGGSATSVRRNRRLTFSPKPSAHSCGALPSICWG